MVVSSKLEPLAVTLRPARPADAALLHAWRAEPTVRRHQPLSDASVADLRTDLARQRPEELYRGQGERFQWIVVVAGEPAGWITLAVASWEHGIAEVGYALGTPFQGRGVMTAALTQLFAELFGHTALERIEARCSIDNFASQAVLDKLGFTREGLLRGYFELDGRRVDNHLFALLRTDYFGVDRS
jgi:ribosomal-protein-alanine N-acetyltransferase